MNFKPVFDPDSRPWGGDRKSTWLEGKSHGLMKKCVPVLGFFGGGCGLGESPSQQAWLKNTDFKLCPFLRNYVI